METCHLATFAACNKSYNSVAMQVDHLANSSITFLEADSSARKLMTLSEMAPSAGSCKYGRRQGKIEAMQKSNASRKVPASSICHASQLFGEISRVAPAQRHFSDCI